MNLQQLQQYSKLASELEEVGVFEETGRKGGKTASVRELSAYSQLFNELHDGIRGEAAQAALAGHLAGLSPEFELPEPMKVASSEETDEERRKRRLAELLKKREPTGTATGSASPNPPQG
jgi:hypothetical protein